MNRNRTRNGLLAVVLGLWLPWAAQAGLDEEMDRMFAEMVNATPAGVYETQRRGVITGGSLVTRNRVVHPQLISFVPPSAKGGCGGIDLFMGSFSYINGEQITQLLRSVAQGAVGYAFQLAIEGMCPTCSQVMTKLQKDIQNINSVMKNSCEFSKQLVNGSGLKAWRDKEMHDAADLDTSKGFLPDYFSSKENNSPTKAAIANGAENEITGNVVHESLKEASAMAWFVNGDEQLQRVLMSLTGTMITGVKDDKSDVRYDYRQPLIKPRDFIEGGNIEVYKCESDQCLLPNGESDKETIHFTGMRERVKKIVFGTGTCKTCTGGIIRKTEQREGGSKFVADESKFIELSSPGILGMIQHLSAQPQSAALVADRMVDVLATEMTDLLVDEMFEVVRNSVTGTSKSLDTAMLDAMRDLRLQIDEQRRKNGETIAAISTVLDTYQNVLASLRDQGFNKAQ